MKAKQLEKQLLLNREWKDVYGQLEGGEWIGATQFLTFFNFKGLTQCKFTRCETMWIS
jgi:hypothetical protein